MAMNRKILQYLALCLSLALPMVAGAALAGLPVAETLVYNVLWCGFYGCLLLCLFWQKTLLKIFFLALNGGCFLFIALGAMMGGAGALGILLLKALIPFGPWLDILG